MKTLLWLEKKYAGRITAQAGPLAEAHYWNDMEKARSKNDIAFGNGGHLTGCGCPSNKIAVRTDGSIVPCTMLAHMELGQINKNSFEEIWQKNTTLNNLRQRHKISLTDFEFCSDCNYLDYCTGNCPGLAYVLTGEVNKPSPDACLKKFLADGGKIPALEKST